MPALPRASGFDSSLALLADPYRFIGRECHRHGTDLFAARILLQPTICMTGPRAAQLFYDRDRFQRTGAAPEPVRATLFGKGGVQGLDGRAHRHRKALFMSLMTRESIASLVELTTRSWEESARHWASRSSVVLYDELLPLLARPACQWAGIPLGNEELKDRSRMLASLFAEAASKDLGHLRARLARRRAERWVGGVIRRVRQGRLGAAPGSALDRVATHRDLGGNLLPTRVAAVELLNLIRPIVAVSVFITFVAHALNAQPRWRERVQRGSDDEAELFVQEVRRFYPFFPAVAARTREAFEWEGFRFPAGIRVLLDLYGTNRDPRSWENPDQFDPDRFRGRQIDAFALVSQGGAGFHDNHRCPGEWITIEIMKLSARFLATQLSYELPLQNLELDYGRLPALPRDRFRMTRIRIQG